MGYVRSNVSVPLRMRTRVLSRFFDQVGHENMFASSVNKHFFTKQCHCQTYQNYEQPPQSQFLVLKIG